MTHNNISFFIPHLGCPHCCSFCSQRKISGTEEIPSIYDIQKTCTEALERIKNPDDTEIAFFGGSFTAIPENQMLEFLDSVQGFIGENKFHGIRVSTRPDAIDRHILDILKKYQVTSIELGAQSMSDEVLQLNERGHTAEQVERASELIKEYNFSLGLQMMTGLYGSNFDLDRYTAEKIAEMQPETVRIYPTVVMQNTKLEEIYKKGLYKMYSLEEMAEFCGKLLEFFDSKNIKVIKCGLHAEKGVEENMIAGYYHQSFRELCESSIYRWKMQAIIDNDNNIYDKKQYTFLVGRGEISKAVGQKKSNKIFFHNIGIEIKIKELNQKKSEFFCIKEE